MIEAELARSVMQRIDALAQISDERGRLTRTFCSPAMRRANELVGAWMREAGMEVRQDAIGNLIGHYPSSRPEGRILLLGSHLDTVRDAGKFDGALGVVLAIACVQRLHESKKRLPFALEIIGFADEEGVRYQSAYLGSKVVAGNFNLEDLKRTDAEGITMAEAIIAFGGDPSTLGCARVDSRRLLGYVEVHIEQGPVLEQKHLAVGVVSAIAGQTRIKVTFIGRAGHAGTVPMDLRRDALCAAAQFILAVEEVAKSGLGFVATIGEISALPGATNVIPGEVRLSLEVRHAADKVRKAACSELLRCGEKITTARNIQFNWERVQETPAVKCDPQLCSTLGEAVKRHQPNLMVLPSGAGHDAAAMAAITPVAMLFVRCKGGISHHPDESVSVEDVALAISVMNDFIAGLAETK